MWNKLLDQLFLEFNYPSLHLKNIIKLKIKAEFCILNISSFFNWIENYLGRFECTNNLTHKLLNKMHLSKIKRFKIQQFLKIKGKYNVI